MAVSAANLTPDKRFMALFVGDSGSGKTPASTSWFHEGKVLNFDFDNRIRGVMGCPWLDLTKLDYNSYPAVQPGLEVVYNRLNKDLEMFKLMAAAKQNPYKTVVISSLGQQQWLHLKDAVSLTHISDNGRQKGRHIGELQLPEPGDYQFVYGAINNVLTFFRGIPDINIIVEAHIVDTFSRQDPNDPYSQMVVSGKKLAITNQLAATIPGGFDHIFEFDRTMQGDKPKFQMRFWGDLARTTFPNMPQGWQDITNRDFYLFMHEQIKQGSDKSKEAVAK